ncbi:MAG TPA: bacteriophage holin [Gammaproteobacteria bacterium]|nr:bacteriophage holin [Gammaproteobacteria bacterium]
MRLNAKALGLALGILWGLSVFLATGWIILMGSSADALAELGVFYIGYEISWTGAVVGLGYGFVDGLIGGVLLAWIYNAFLPRPDLP